MESEAADFVLRTDGRRKTVKEMPAEKGKKKTDERYERKKVAIKKKYDAVSKHGDTLELSKNGRELGKQADIGGLSVTSDKNMCDYSMIFSENKKRST